ncbi:MAG: hypothetical protein J6W82_10195 [Bacteroidales bacterium]|nr:hypothetical protein [Bacteroidales bacterium]
MKKIIFAAFVTLAFFLSAEAPAQESLHDGHKAHEEGILINLWPTKDAVEVNLAYALGADYICTDRPRLICSLIDEGVIPVKK